MSPIITVKNIGKRYTISHQGNKRANTLRDEMEGWFKNLARKRLKEELPSKEEFWALKDVSFDIEPGDRVGIIGRNGAGKSTLLKILSRITEPTTGEIRIKGRVASLLEVGTGFHQELSGRENIYLNGAILGMSRVEIKKKFDEIVAFSEVEKFLDTPVKRYSSGMYVRLAFAIAAHLEPEILIVDEVLAVGDAQFQKKCLGKMEDVSKEGRTVLFVSHNMGAIRQLCNKGIMLQNGSTFFVGAINETISKYMVESNLKGFNPFKIKSLGLEIRNITINKDKNGAVVPFDSVKISIEIFAEKELKNIGLIITMSSEILDERLFFSSTANTKNYSFAFSKGINRFTCIINSFKLCSGRYMLGFGIDRPNITLYHFDQHTLRFDVNEIVIPGGNLTTVPSYGICYMDHHWAKE